MARAPRLVSHTGGQSVRRHGKARQGGPCAVLHYTGGLSVISATPIGHAINEALALGARFRLSGGEVEIAQLAELPDEVRQTLQGHSSYLFALLDGGQD